MKRFIGIGVILISLFGCSRDHISTQEALRRRFVTHSSDFERVVAILKETKKFRTMSCDELKMPTREKIARNDVRAKELISDSQWETLCVTFRKLGLTEDVGMSGDRTSIMFWYEVSGLVTGGKVSGIIYSEEALSPLIADLDTVSASGRYYSKLDRPNWYLLRWID